MPRHIQRGDQFSSDPGDSVLAAEIAAVQSLVTDLASPTRRIAIVTYSDTDPATNHPGAESATGSIDELIEALERVHDAGSSGGGQFSVGMKRAVDALLHSSPRSDDPRRIVLFVADSPEPRFRSSSGKPSRADASMGEEAQRAIDASIVFNTFGLDEAAEVALPHHLARIAGVTGGSFTRVRDAGFLHCQLFNSLFR